MANTKYLSDFQIDELARAAFVCFEWTASWRQAGRAAAEYALDEYAVRATSGQIGTAVRRAQVQWEAAKTTACRAVGAA